MKTVLLLLTLIAANNFAVAEEPLQPVKQVDLERYLGKWYEIAAIPQKFQAKCLYSEAEYRRTLVPGFILVINSCELRDNPGKTKTARGLAWITDKKSNAKLKVTFFPPFAGDYWIIELADDYSYAVVGHPGRKYLWILSRSKTMSAELYAELLQKIAVKHGYETKNIVRTRPL